MQICYGTGAYELQIDLEDDDQLLLVVPSGGTLTYGGKKLDPLDIAEEDLLAFSIEPLDAGVLDGGIRHWEMLATYLGVDSETDLSSIQEEDLVEVDMQIQLFRESSDTWGLILSPTHGSSSSYILPVLVADYLEAVYSKLPKAHWSFNPIVKKNTNVLDEGLYPAVQAIIRKGGSQGESDLEEDEDSYGAEV